MELPAILTKKLGPLPTWGWVLAGAGAGWFLLRKKGTPTQQLAALGTGTGTVPGSGAGGASGGGGGVVTPPAVVTPPVVTPPTVSPHAVSTGGWSPQPYIVPQSQIINGLRPGGPGWGTGPDGTVWASGATYTALQQAAQQAAHQLGQQISAQQQAASTLSGGSTGAPGVRH